MMMFRSFAIAAVVLASLYPACAAAQRDRTAVEAKHRADCRLAEQVLTHGRPANKRDWAEGIILSCDERATVAVSLWRDPPRDTAELNDLIVVSHGVRDGRLYETTFGLVRDESMPARVRIAALGTLVSMIDPHVVLDLTLLRPIEGLERPLWSSPWGSIDHADFTTSPAHPLPADAAAMVSTVAADLAESASDTAVRDSAWWLVTLIGIGDTP